MKKYSINKRAIWIVVFLIAGLLTAGLWYLLQPLERIRAVSCEPAQPSSINTCARIIETYDRIGIRQTYKVEFTPSNTGNFESATRKVEIPIEASCGIQFAAAQWTAEAFTITTQSDPTLTCAIERTKIGSWL